MGKRCDWEFTAWVAHLTQEEADKIGEAITDIVCGGAGEGEAHVCQRVDWVTNHRPAKPDDE
jgi:hypothetical protein